MVSPIKLEDFYKLTKERRIQHEVIHENVAHLIESNEFSNETEFGWKSYHSLEEMYDWLDSLPKKYPDVVEILNAGSTYEGRVMKGVKISYRRNNPAIFIESGIHANEWIAPATATYLINELLTSKNSSVRMLAESYDWYIFPSFNPDGYAYTRSSVSKTIEKFKY